QIVRADPGSGFYSVTERFTITASSVFGSTTTSAVITFVPPASAVPGPIVGAGLPGLILASGGLLGWWRRRRKIAWTSGATDTHWCGLSDGMSADWRGDRWDLGLRKLASLELSFAPQGARRIIGHRAGLRLGQFTCCTAIPNCRASAKFSHRI